MTTNISLVATTTMATTHHGYHTYGSSSGLLSSIALRTAVELGLQLMASSPVLMNRIV